MKTYTHFIIAILFSSSFSLSIANSNSSAYFSHYSLFSLLASPISMLVGSYATLYASGIVLVTSVKTVGKSTIIVVEGISEAGKASAEIAVASTKQGSIAVGDSLTIVQEESGIVLHNEQGDLFAFMPNKRTQQHIHQQKRQWQSAL